MSSYVKHHLKPKLKEKEQAKDSMLSTSSAISSKIHQHVPVVSHSNEDSEVPEERGREDFNNLRRLFKGHKISEPHFGDRKNSKGSNMIMKGTHANSEKHSAKKKVARKNISNEKKSHKATPQKVIDFTAYLNKTNKSIKNSSAFDNHKSVKVSCKATKRVPKVAVNSRNNFSINESINKSNSSLKSSQSRSKKPN